MHRLFVAVATHAQCTACSAHGWTPDEAKANLEFALLAICLQDPDCVSAWTVHEPDEIHVRCEGEGRNQC